jgi:hypothetical protein
MDRNTLWAVELVINGANRKRVTAVAQTVDPEAASFSSLTTATVIVPLQDSSAAHDACPVKAALSAWAHAASGDL